jgi:ABC-type transport system involved in multi-copper enzyme maturation permease subunit
MTAHVVAIGVNTFREAMRARVLYVLLAAGVLTMSTATLMSPLALGEGVRITKDVGLTTIDVLGLLIITLLGTTIVYKEIEKRTIVVLLSKPIRRFEFVLGKFVGLSLCLLLVVVVETAFLEAAVLLTTGAIDPRLVAGAGMGFMMLITVNAVAVMYSSFAGPLVAAFLTFSTFVAGNLVDQLAGFAAQHDVAALRYVFYALPNLASMDVRAEVVHGFAFDPAGLGLAIAHGLSYAAGALLIAVMAFRNREFR